MIEQLMHLHVYREDFVAALAVGDELISIYPNDEPVLETVALLNEQSGR